MCTAGTPFKSHMNVHFYRGTADQNCCSVVVVKRSSGCTLQFTSAELLSLHKIQRWDCPCMWVYSFLQIKEDTNITTGEYLYCLRYHKSEGRLLVSITVNFNGWICRGSGTQHGNIVPHQEYSQVLTQMPDYLLVLPPHVPGHLPQPVDGI